MKTFKNIILSAALVIGLAVSVQAANVSASITGASYGMLLSAPNVSSQFTFANATTNGTLISLYDSATTNFVVTNASWITTTYTQASITNIYTNYFGVLTTNIYTALVTGSVTNAAATNTITGMLSVYVPATSTTVLDGTYRFNNGILVSNSVATTTVSATYR